MNQIVKILAIVIGFSFLFSQTAIVSGANAESSDVDIAINKCLKASKGSSYTTDGSLDNANTLDCSMTESKLSVEDIHMNTVGDVFRTSFSLSNSSDSDYQISPKIPTLSNNQYLSYKYILRGDNDNVIAITDNPGNLELKKGSSITVDIDFIYSNEAPSGTDINSSINVEFDAVKILAKQGNPQTDDKTVFYVAIVIVALGGSLFIIVKNPRRLRTAGIMIVFACSATLLANTYADDSTNLIVHITAKNGNAVISLNEKTALFANIFKINEALTAKYGENITVTKVERSKMLGNKDVPIISSDNSPLLIYAWLNKDNSTLYYYTRTERIDVEEYVIENTANGNASALRDNLNAINEQISNINQMTEKYPSDWAPLKNVLETLESSQRSILEEIARNYGAASITTGDPDKGGYPYSEQCPTAKLNGTQYIDQWGMYICENVSYAAWKVFNTYGYMPFWGGRGNASQWPTNAQEAGYVVSSIPKEKTVGIIRNTSGGYGHAVWVESVSGSRVYVSQYNAINVTTNNLPGDYSEAWYDASAFVYIYFK